VTLVERRRRLGGATWSFRHNGLWFDNGQHVFLRCCTAYIGFLERLGVADRVRLQRRLDVPVIAPGGRTARLRRSRVLPAPAHLGRSLLAYRHLPIRDRLRLVPAALALRRVDLAAAGTDDETFGGWLTRHHQSPAAIAALWDLICRPTVNLPAPEASLALAAMVFQTGLLTDAPAADIGWASVPLGELHGDAGRRALEAAGVEVLAGVPATAVRRPPGHDRSGFTVAAGDSERDADAVVVAVPHTALGEVTADVGNAVPADLTARLGVSPIVNVHVVYDRRVTDLELAAGVGTDAQFVFDRTTSSGLAAAGPRGQYLAVSLSAADEHMGRPSEDVKARVVASLATLFPRAREATVVDALVSREPAATFRGAPGSAAARPPSTTAVPGLVLAGAWTATGWPATMEGAVRSGRAAARHALLAAGQTRNVPAVPAAAEEEVPAVSERQRANHEHSHLSPRSGDVLIGGPEARQ
jgi:squalene-associated FAD-dependent desaturase